MTKTQNDYRIGFTYDPYPSPPPGYKPLTRLDKVSLAITIAAFGLGTVLGWYVRSSIGGEKGKTIASIIFSLGLVVMLVTLVARRYLMKRMN